MNKSQQIILGIAAAVLVVMILFPPYFVIDRESGGRTHAAIGYHWIGHPPSAVYAYQKLAGGDSAGVAPERLAALAVRVNVVRFGSNVILLALLVALAMMRYRSPGREPRREEA